MSMNDEYFYPLLLTYICNCSIGTGGRSLGTRDSLCNWNKMDHLDRNSESSPKRI